MFNGISGAPIPKHLRYAADIQAACAAANFSPCLAYAIAWRETIYGEVHGLWPSACSVVSGDKGYGLYQLTYPFMQPWPPENWSNAATNATLALKHYLIPALGYFVGHGVVGNVLVACTAAGFNSGDETTWANHLKGNVDIGTTDHYAAAVLNNYHRLIAGGNPV